MRIIGILLLILITGPLAFAQITRNVSLEQALQLSLENSAQLKKSRLEREGIKQRIRLERGMSFPQVDAGISYDYYPVLPTQYLPGAVLGQPDLAYVPVTYGQPGQLTANVQVEQLLFSEAGRRAMPAVDVTRNLYDLLIQKSEEDVLFQTASVFYQTLQTQQLLHSVDANLEKLDALQRMVELQLKNGFAVPTDVKRVKVTHSNLLAQRQRLVTAITSLRQSLQFLCGVPLDEPFEPVAEMNNPAADSTRWQALTYTLDATTEYQILQKQIDLYHIQWKSQRAEGYPTLSAHAAGFYQAQSPNLNVFDGDTQWYGMAMVGFKVKVPLFDGFRRHRKADLLRLEAQKLEVDRRLLTGAKDLEYRQAKAEFQNSLSQLRTQEENVALAHEIADKLILQYKEGVTPLTDVLNAQTTLSEAETNYWQQVFAYKLAALKLMKATGRMQELKEGN